MINLGTDKELPAIVGVSIPLDNKENRFGAVGNLEIKLWDKVDLKSNLEYSNGSTFGNFLRSEKQFEVRTD